METKGERREERKRNRRKMRVSGRGLKRLVQELETRGMLTRTEPYLYLAPPLTLTREEADEIVSIIDESLKVVEAEA